MWKLLAPLLLAAAPGAAQTPARASYETYAHGIDVLDLDVAFEVNPSSYSVHVRTRTVGAVGVLFSMQVDTTVTGTFAGARPHPLRYYSTGHMRGRPRVTLIDYVGDAPEVRTLTPPNADDERDDVTAEEQAHTVDTLSAMAELLRQVMANGRCEGSLATFDGRRVATLTAHTSGEEALERTSRSSFAGPALRCNFEGQQTAGFKHDEDMEVARRVQHGSAWFARVIPGGPVLPVRIEFTNRVFGQATMYLTGSGAQGSGAQGSGSQ